MPKNILNYEYPSQGIVMFGAGSEGKAVVETPDGKVYSFDLSRPKGERFVEEKSGFQMRTWLPRGIGSQFRPAGEFPFTELETYFESQSRIFSV